MQPASTNQNHTLSGTVAGTLLVIFNLNLSELSKAAVLAATGAAVSFTVSFLLNTIARNWNRRKRKKFDKD